MCPSGFYGFDCSTQTFNECYMNITDPPFYQSCGEGKEDSPYYMFSIPGFDPCYFIDFTKSYDVKFKFVCRATSISGVVDTNLENVGYPYRDVTSIAPTPSFNYTAASSNSNYKILVDSPYLATIDIRDMKWLSNYYRFQTNVTDPDIMVGNTEGTITVDFNSISQSDLSNDTYYIVGGRTYFETGVYGSSVTSYTGKGFFDQMNYVEPASNKINTNNVIIGVVVTVAGLAIIAGVGGYCCYQKKKKVEHID